MKKLHGTRIFVQSAGVRHEREIDGFSISVCEEIGVELSQHRTRSFEEMEEWGDQIGGYDLIVALSPASLRHAQEYTRYNAIDVEYWPLLDPTGIGETREDKLQAYRQTRDQIIAHIKERFAQPPERRKNVERSGKGD